MRKTLLFLLPIALIGIAAIYYKSKPKEEALMSLSSSSFGENQAIPRQHSCEGEDLPIPLAFKNIPKKSESLALIMEDPDAPNGTVIHWVAWNIDPKTHELANTEAINNISQGTNSAQKVGYKGPCPPYGQHRYYIRLYALDNKLDLPATTTKDELLNAMKGHILSEAELMGTYKKEL